jgi:hypothetical protein
VDGSNTPREKQEAYLYQHGINSFSKLIHFLHNDLGNKPTAEKPLEIYLFCCRSIEHPGIGNWQQNANKLFYREVPPLCHKLYHAMLDHLDELHDRYHTMNEKVSNEHSYPEAKTENDKYVEWRKKTKILRSKINTSYICRNLSRSIKKTLNSQINTIRDIYSSTVVKFNNLTSNLSNSELYLLGRRDITSDYKQTQMEFALLFGNSPYLIEIVTDLLRIPGMISATNQSFFNDMLPRQVAAAADDDDLPPYEDFNQTGRGRRQDRLITWSQLEYYMNLIDEGYTYKQVKMMMDAGL